MPDALPSEPNQRPLADEVVALRREVQFLRTQQAAATYADARFQTVFDNSPLGQKIIGSDLVIREVNPAMLAMLGMRHTTDLVGRKIMEFTHPNFQATWHALQRRLWQRAMPHFTLETCLVRPDGSSFWCQVTSILFLEKGEELGYTILEDISARKKDESTLRQLHEAQEIVLHLATHDLRAPLATVQLLTDLLERDFATLPPEQARQVPPETTHFLKLIREAGLEADRLLAEVLYLGGPNADELEWQPLNLTEWLPRQLETHETLARTHGITLALHLPEAPVPVTVQPEQLRRVLDNLLSNAFKFTPAPGHVEVRVQLHEGRTRVLVQDNGIGIPAPLQKSLFEKFSSARRPGLRGEPATGLGLFIARQIMRLHHGRIWVESHDQQGACFVIEL